MILSKDDVINIGAKYDGIAANIYPNELFAFVDEIERAVLYKVSQQEPVPYLPFLSNRADGVDGHYSIGRYNPNLYYEYWNLKAHKWSSCSDEILTLSQATELLQKIEIPTKPAPKQLPIYMWRLHGEEGWMECTKEWFDADISSGYEKRIVYAHPLPPQAAAIPESTGIDFDFINDCLLCYKSQLYIDGAEGLRNKIDEQIAAISAAPKPESKS